MTFLQQSDKRFDENWKFWFSADYYDKKSHPSNEIKKFLHAELRAFAEEMKKEIRQQTIEEVFNELMKFAEADDNLKQYIIKVSYDFIQSIKKN